MSENASCYVFNHARLFAFFVVIDEYSETPCHAMPFHSILALSWSTVVCLYPSLSTLVGFHLLEFVSVGRISNDDNDDEECKEKGKTY
jgi:hypothetical protein